MNTFKTGTLALAILAFAGQADASGGSKIYDLTCGIKLGSGALEVVKTARVQGDSVTLDGVTGFGSYTVQARRRHVTAKVTETGTNQSSQFAGEIEIHGGDHHSNAFEIVVNPAESGFEKVTLVCTGKRIRN